MSAEIEAKRSKFITQNDISKVEKIVVESILNKALTKLRFLLPLKTPSEAEWKRLEDLSGSLNTNLLHDVVNDTLTALAAKGTDLQNAQASKLAAKAAEKTITSMYNHVFSREIIQRNVEFGNTLRDLIISALVEYDANDPESFPTLRNFIASRHQATANQAEAQHYLEQQSTDAETELAAITQAVAETQQELTTNLESWRLQEKHTDNEVYENNIRVNVELEYTEDFTEHQLQYMNFAREQEEQAVSQRRLTALREAEFLPVVHKGTMGVLKLLSEQEQARHLDVMDVMEAEQRVLERQLWEETRSVENMESDLACMKIALQHHNEMINYLRSVRAEEVIQEMELARLLNAVIRIQRWWRWKMWINRKKKKKSKKGKGKKGKGGKSKSKSRSKGKK